jgi:hypothetical protein
VIRGQTGRAEKGDDGRITPAALWIFIISRGIVMCVRIQLSMSALIGLEAEIDVIEPARFHKDVTHRWPELLVRSDAS